MDPFHSQRIAIDSFSHSLSLLILQDLQSITKPAYHTSTPDLNIVENYSNMHTVHQ